jgi:PBP1b-binding outer membrane lipoprotein LpoB
VPQKFENGGTIAIREAKEMANSQAIELKHHASELANVLKKNPTIEAWVIAKLERASSDLSDVTHYLEGRVQMSGKKMANGGSISDNMVKVKVDYLEQQYFQLEKEMEIPLSVYKEYDKTGKVPLEITHDLISETTLEHHVETNPISVRLTPVTSNKMKSGGNMEFERPTYQSNYVASQSQANEIADENWNMDYENDPLIKSQKKAKETATRIGMAVATRGMSEATPKTDGSSSMDMSPLMKGVK